MIYIFDKLDCIDEAFVMSYSYLMPPERQQKCLRYKNILDKKLCLVSYLLLVYALKQEYGISGRINFIYNEYGKPYLADYPNIYFSLSHCPAAAACAVSKHEIGIDIEEYHHYDSDLAKAVCSEEELANLEKSSDKSRLFSKYWIEKESFLKLKGLTKNIGSSMECFKKSYMYESYALSVSINKH